MGEVLPFKAGKREPNQKGNTLCRNGHHQWKIITSRQFDVKQGRLVTVFECRRCAKKKVKAL